MKIKIEDDKVVESGTYKAKFDGLELRLGMRHGDAYKVNFTIVDGEYDGCKVNGLCSTSLRYGTKLYDWTSAISGGNLTPGKELDIDDLIGRKCKVIVQQVERGDRKYANVSIVLKHEDDEPPF